MKTLGSNFKLLHYFDKWLLSTVEIWLLITSTMLSNHLKASIN